MSLFLLSLVGGRKGHALKNKSQQPGSSSDKRTGLFKMVSFVSDLDRFFSSWALGAPFVLRDNDVFLSACVGMT